MRTLLGATALVVLAAGCKADLNIDNPNSATVSGATSDPSALQLLATGLFVDQRGTRGGFITNAGIFGRESYTFSPQDGRFTTHPLIGITVGGIQKIDPTGFSVGPWGGEYGALRDIFNFKNTITANATLSAAQKSPAIGMAQTFEGLMLLEIVQTHDTLGGITEIKDNPTDLSPFVTRDSVYKYILNTFDAAAKNLAAGGGSFPFTLPPGFKGFDTPTTFAQFTMALKARAAANYATLGGGSAAWQATLSALNASFMNTAATSRAQFDVGVYDTYGASPDSPNPLSSATNTNLYAHMSIQKDVQMKADGVTPDDRYTAKIRTGLQSRQGPITADGPTSASSTLGFSIWPTVSSPIPIIRNEELILLQAEARLATGDKAGAIADINQVRVNSGGLPPSTLTAGSSADDILTGILYEKRYSLLMEGQRWIDMRRYNRLDQLPLDVASGPNKNFVAKVNPIPQSECLVRAKVTGNLLGPNGQNDCAP
ncbi:MAG TPA: RagB/SusD family nutrient uptake outer membrane protein [Gemmatimonadaceae bacterium]|nr:RagB/SusD family nutrient uptake outer membrane protein [Gemmatimonadaceae bacterium]